MDDIECGVHLILKFGHQVGATVKKKRLIEQSQRTVTVTLPTSNGSSEGTLQVKDGDSDFNQVAAGESDVSVATATLKVKL